MGRPPNLEKTVWKHIAIPEKVYVRCQEIVRYFNFRSVSDYLMHLARIDLQKRELDIEVEKSKREGYAQ